MVYGALKGLVLRVFRAPGEPPAPPVGEYTSVDVFRASPSYLTYRLLGLLILTAFLACMFLLFLGIAIFEERGAAFLAGGLLAIAGPLLALNYFLIHLDYDLRYYVVTDRSVRVREGAWTVKEMTLTYANVQNLRVSQGPLQRLLGIRDLHISAAGGGGVSPDGKTAGGGHSVIVAGVENAGELRDRIQAHLRKHRGGAGLGDPDDERAGPLGLATPEALEELRRMRAAAQGLRAAADRSGLH